ncbi:MAG: PIN domain-containing protein [Cyanobacteria bacterium J06634_6]
MASRLTVLYDACVLYPNYLRDILVQLATTDLFQVKWTERIHDEWTRNLLLNRPDTGAERLEKLRQKVIRSAPDSLVTNYEYIISSLELPDLNDRHVLAAGIVAKADIIVTFNLKDFPADILSGYDIKAQHPDDFIADLIDLDALRVFEAIQAIVNRLRKPPVGFEGYMEILLNQGLLTSVSLLRGMRNKK